jgi:hypothetical protein
MTKREADARTEFGRIMTEESGGYVNAARVADLLCRHGKTYARIQEANCNGVGTYYGEDQARFAKRQERFERELERRESKLEDLIRRKCQELGEGFVPVFGGDPRGNTIKIKVPSGRTNDWGGEGISVPTS